MASEIVDSVSSVTNTGKPATASSSSAASDDPVAAVLDEPHPPRPIEAMAK